MWHLYSILLNFVVCICEHVGGTHISARERFLSSNNLCTLLFSYPAEPIRDPVAISNELELRPREIGEIIVSGWHVNTFQVTLICVYSKPFAVGTVSEVKVQYNINAQLRIFMGAPASTALAS